MAVDKTSVNGTVPVPYMHAYGYITKVLEAIIKASTPERFTQDFLATKLGLKGGSAKPVIPFLKRTGFLLSDGSPTEQYKQFRNESKRGLMAANALKTGYAGLYEVNEYAHDLDDKELKGVIVQVTGLDAASSTVQGIIGSFKAVKAHANFDAVDNGVVLEDGAETEQQEGGNKIPPAPATTPRKAVDLRLGYTINLNLPATSDIAVFDAIFKSLRANMLDQ